MKNHKKLVAFEKSIKASKKACQKWGIDYKRNPYCIGIKGNYAKELLNFKYVR